MSYSDDERTTPRATVEPMEPIDTDPAPTRERRFDPVSVTLALSLTALVLAGTVVCAVGWIAFSATRSPAASAAATTGGVSGAVPPSGAAQGGPPSIPGSPTTLTVAAVGDMSFGRSVGKLIAQQGGAAPLANVAPLLASADIAVGNLEGTIATGGPRATWKDVTLIGDPRALAGLQLAGFDELALANNHAFDYGWPAMRCTITLLDGARIGHAGAGADSAAAWRPSVTAPRGEAVAFLAFTRVLPAGFGAGSHHPGVASAYENAQVAHAIKAAKRRYGQVIVSFHWGVEYADEPTPQQVGLAHEAVDAGADLVIGHHPHVIQGLERYRGRLIAYSLGDFVFQHNSRKTGESFILTADLGPGGVANVGVTPVLLDGYGRPSVVRGAEAQRILGRLRSLSAERRTKIAFTGDLAHVVQ